MDVHRWPVVSKPTMSHHADHAVQTDQHQAINRMWPAGPRAVHYQCVAQQAVAGARVHYNEIMMVRPHSVKWMLVFYHATGKAGFRP